MWTLICLHQDSHNFILWCSIILFWVLVCSFCGAIILLWVLVWLSDVPHGVDCPKLSLKPLDLFLLSYSLGCSLECVVDLAWGSGWRCTLALDCTLNYMNTLELVNLSVVSGKSCSWFCLLEMLINLFPGSVIVCFSVIDNKFSWFINIWDLLSNAACWM